MGSGILPSVDAVTAVHYKNWSTVLIGIGDAAYDRRASQRESLLNSHHLRSKSVDVDDRAEERGSTIYEHYSWW